MNDPGLPETAPGILTDEHAELPQRQGVFRLPRRRGSGMLRCGVIIDRMQRRSPEESCTAEFAMVYICAGAAVYSDAQHESIPLTPGHLMLRMPDRPHKVSFEEGEWFGQCYLAMPPAICDVLRLTNAFRRQTRPVLWLGYHQSIVHRFEVLTEELRAVPELRLYQVVARMHEFAAELITRQYDQGAPAPAQLVDHACELLTRDLDKRLNLPAVAQELGVSYSLFRKQFREQTGMPPGDYRIRRRIEYSQELICAPGATVKSVARQLGYPDVYVFAKQFKKVTGNTPGQFQKENRL